MNDSSRPLATPATEAAPETAALAADGSRPRLVLKFGGTSVAGLERIEAAARKAVAEIERGHDVLVLVSAMSGETNKLVELTKEADPLRDPREYDAIVSSGEQVTAGLMAIMLQKFGAPARSWQGWQIPIRCDGAHGAARIETIETSALSASFRAGMHAVVAGFQGLGPDNRIATLGRGGSDTSAVALAAAIGAVRCDIYTDVDGVYTTDPRVASSARRVDRIAHEEMLELASLGAKVLQTRSVEFAMRYGMPLQVLSSFEPSIGSDLPGTLVCPEEEVLRHYQEVNVESPAVTGVAYQRNEAKITVARVLDKPGVAAAVFGPLAAAGVNVDMIVQDISEDGRTSMTFTVSLDDCDRAVEALKSAREEIGYADLVIDRDVSKVSIVGLGMRSHSGVAQSMFKALAEKGVNIQVISTSEIKVSVLIERNYMELAVRTLHTAFGLDAAPA